jgi:hypothetical protein
VLVGTDDERSLAVLARSLQEHASRPLHLWALSVSRDVVPDPSLDEQLPGLRVTWVPAHRLGGALRTPGGRRARTTVVARLALPRLLRDVPRVVLLQLPAVATADIAELADLDLGPHAVAAPRRDGGNASGFAVVHKAAFRLGTHADIAAELRRTTHARHTFDFDAFTGDVLVLDLAQLREEAFAEQSLALVRDHGLRDLEALHVLLGPNRADVPPAWATVPTRTDRREPGLLVWADPVKPADEQLTAERAVWRRHDEALNNKQPSALVP